LVYIDKHVSLQTSLTATWHQFCLRRVLRFIQCLNFAVVVTVTYSGQQ